MESKLDSLTSLFRAAGIPSAREDAEILLNKFGSLTYLMQCDSFALKNHTDCSDKALHLIRLAAELTSRRITDQFRAGKKYTEDDLRRYAVGLTLACSVENVYCIFLDSAGRLISAEWLGDGVINSVGIAPRKMLECAYRAKAKQIVLVHNHPCGNPTPSTDDFNATMAFKSVAESSDMKVIAHYVVSGFNVCDIMKSSTRRTLDDCEAEIMRVNLPIFDKE